MAGVIPGDHAEDEPIFQPDGHVDDPLPTIPVARHHLKMQFVAEKFLVAETLIAVTIQPTHIKPPCMMVCARNFPGAGY